MSEGEEAADLQHKINMERKIFTYATIYVLTDY